MTDSVFEIGTDAVDAEKVMAEVEAAVARKMDTGAYKDARIACAEKTNLANLKGDEEFVQFYLECLRDSVFVDISDFEIHERRRTVGTLLITLKKIIWKLLKFYTYRLWSQQNQVNGMLVTAIEGIDEKYRKRLQDLGRRLTALEGDKTKSSHPKSCQQPDA